MLPAREALVFWWFAFGIEAENQIEEQDYHRLIVESNKTFIIFCEQNRSKKPTNFEI